MTLFLSENNRFLIFGDRQWRRTGPTSTDIFVNSASFLTNSCNFRKAKRLNSSISDWFFINLELSKLIGSFIISSEHKSYSDAEMHGQTDLVELRILQYILELQQLHRYGRELPPPRGTVSMSQIGRFAAQFPLLSFFCYTQWVAPGSPIQTGDSLRLLSTSVVHPSFGGQMIMMIIFFCVANAALLEVSARRDAVSIWLTARVRVLCKSIVSRCSLFNDSEYFFMQQTNGVPRKVVRALSPITTEDPLSKI